LHPEAAGCCPRLCDGALTDGASLSDDPLTVTRGLFQQPLMLSVGSLAPALEAPHLSGIEGERAAHRGEQHREEREDNQGRFRSVRAHEFLRRTKV